MSYFSRILIFLLLLFPFLSACAQTDQQSTDKTYAFEKIADGLQGPVDLVHAGDGSGRLFVVEKDGTIRIIKDGEVLIEPFLEIEDRTSKGGERGLLGLAFHPNYADNGLFYINYTNASGDTVVAQYSVSNDAAKADKASEQILLTITQPEGNHNGGDLAFGPDGYLYVATGDGGGGGDRHGEIGNGQDLTTLLGKLLRIEVGNNSYATPNSNPFIGNADARDEIWAYGLRNPWRFSFDRETGDLYMGDVGQNAYEEINFQAADSQGGENYGWRIMEGFNCYEPRNGCDKTGLVEPILEYDHSLGSSITGGYVYRGETLSDLVGSYFYGDYSSGRIWQAKQQNDGSWQEDLFMDTDYGISSFGEDEAGELYLVDLRGGGVYRLTAQ